MTTTSDEITIPGLVWSDAVAVNDFIGTLVRKHKVDVKADEGPDDTVVVEFFGPDEAVVNAVNEAKIGDVQ